MGAHQLLGIAEIREVETTIGRRRSLTGSNFVDEAHAAFPCRIWF